MKGNKLIGIIFLYSFNFFFLPLPITTFRFSFVTVSEKESCLFLVTVCVRHTFRMYQFSVPHYSDLGYNFRNDLLLCPHRRNCSICCLKV
jgi:hypothetical protein